MSAKEMYDYITTEPTPDNDYTLTIAARGEAKERGFYNQEVRRGDDGSEEVIDLGGTELEWVLTYPYGALTESEAGDVVDAYCSTSKGHGLLKTFKLQYSDGHTYVVRFDMTLERIRTLDKYHKTQVKFKILGRIPD